MKDETPPNTREPDMPEPTRLLCNSHHQHLSNICLLLESFQLKSVPKTLNGNHAQDASTYRGLHPQIFHSNRVCHYKSTIFDAYCGRGSHAHIDTSSYIDQMILPHHAHHTILQLYLLTLSALRYRSPLMNLILARAAEHNARSMREKPSPNQQSCGIPAHGLLTLLKIN